MSATFLDRLTMLAKGRKLTPWLKSLGWNTGDVGRIKQGHVPGWEKLSRLVETERANLHWLVIGEGDPYVKASRISESAAIYQPSRAQQLDALLAELPDEIRKAVRLLVETASRQKRKGKG